MGAYYNEFDPKAAAWLRQLIKNGVIADGEVDGRSIIEVQANDIRGFTQHHFFAGIGGWSYALRLAGWSDTRPVCTASLPCQPFSVAGTQKGVDDERHLLPHFIELVKQCNFQTIFGEQVPGAIKHGWLDDLCTEMERENYTVGQIVLTAAGEGAPHIRQRLYWVANSSKQRQQGQRELGQSLHTEENTDREINRIIGTGNISNGMENSISNGQRERLEIGGGIFGQHQDGETCDQFERRSEVCRMANSESARAGENKRRLREMPDGHSRMGNSELHGHDASEIGRSISKSKTKGRMFKFEGSDTEWSEPDWLYCRDEKYRPIKSSIEPLANGLPRGVGYSSDPSEPIDANDTQEARVMRLKGYGNAIVPQVAASFIKAFMQC